MKKCLISALGCVLSACTTIPADLPGKIETTLNQPLGANTAIDEKALWNAEAAYNVPAAAYVSADRRGLLSADVKASIKPLLVKAYDLLKAARAAYRVGDAATFADKWNALKEVSAQVSPLIPN